MKVRLPNPVILLMLATCAGLAGSVCAADPLKSGIQLQAETDRAALRSQQRIDQLSDETRALLEAYRRETRELDSLRSYDDHLQRMVEAQQQSIASLQAQLDGVQVTQRGVIPLLARMVDSLAEFVELDTPFLLDERRQRIAELRDLLHQPDASLADKYRRVMEAYQIETDYGRSLEAYRATLETGSGDRSVDFLRVGRVVLLYRSLDGSDAGVWDERTQSWQVLPQQYQSALKQGFRVARKQTTPELLVLPVQAPGVSP
jgi:septal ring factor EnvC (AmiA/AmiB activator)